MANEVSLNVLAVSSPEVVRYVEERAPRAIESWRDLGTAEYGRAFAASQTAGWDVVTDLYEGLLATFQEGGTEEDFAARVVPVLRQKGWLGASEAELGARVQLIYDTNLRLARAAGRWDRIQRAKAIMPYLKGVTARDSRVRHPPKSPHADHRAWEGIVLPVDHPFWRRHFTPLWFRCRCDVIQVTRSQFQRQGLVITDEAELADRERRLGETWGAPGILAGEAIAEVIDAGNDRRMDGLPMIRADAVQARAQNAWLGVLNSLLGDALAGLLG